MGLHDPWNSGGSLPASQGRARPDLPGSPSVTLIEHIARGTLAFAVENRLRVEGERGQEKGASPTQG